MIIYWIRNMWKIVFRAMYNFVRNLKIMATQATTLSAALNLFNIRYQFALGANSKRESDRYQSLQNQINSYFDIVSVSIGENNTVRAQTALDAIVAILVAEGITITDPVLLPLATGIYGSPGIITVPVDGFGLNPVYTNAISTIYVFQGGIDASSSYTFAVQSVTNVTAVIQNLNEVKINTITADEGSVTVRASRTNYGTLYFTIKVFKYYDAQNGISINTYPSTILIPTDSDGTNPILTDAISTQIVRDGIVDETASYTFAIQAVTNVTAVIQNLNEVKINTITAEQGNVTVRATRAGYPDQDYEIPVQKQRKGSSVLDASSVDGKTIKINILDEGYVARDIDGEDALFGSLPDMTSLYNAPFTSPLDPNEYKYRSSNLRRAPSTDTNNGYLALKRLYNIESVDSISTYTVGNFLFGPENFLEIAQDDGNDIGTNVFASSGGTVGNIIFSVGQGDLTAYYTVGKKVLIYVKYNTSETKGVYYYMTGTITSSVFTTLTTVIFTADFSFSDGININFSNAQIAGHILRAVAYDSFVSSTSVIGSYNNFLIGIRNFIRGRSNTIFGDSNVLNEGESNLILGNVFNVNPISASYLGVRGNILIGNGGTSSNVIVSHYNLIIENRNVFDVIQIGHENSGLNLFVGNSNYTGTGTGVETEGFNTNNLFGLFNNARANKTNIFGFAGKSITNGEIVLSSSDSSIQKNIFILEGITTSTSATTIKSLGRSASFISDAESIQVANNTIFSGTLEFIGSETGVGRYSERRTLTYTCDGSGNIVNVSSTLLGTDTIAGTSGAISFITTTPNVFEVQITPGRAASTKWTCIIEGIIMDR